MVTEIELLKTITEKKKTSGKYKKWNNSLFEDIKIMPTSDKGDVCEEFMYELCKKLIDENAIRNPNTRDEWDVMVLRNKIEVKMATEDTSGCFQFNGIRYHRKYDFLLVLGISPNNLYFNIYTGADVKSQKIGNLVSMEKGAVGSQKLTRKKSQLHDISKFKEIVKEVLG